MQDTDKETPAFGGYRELLRIAWPLIISTGSFSVLNFCDRMFLGWYSPEAFRAAVPAGILCFTMTCGFVALAAYSNTFVAQYFGARKYRNCAVATMQGIWLALKGFILGAPLVFLMSRAVRSIFEFGEESLPLAGYSTILLLVLFALLASWLPARRAARIQPVEALNAE